MSHKCSKRIKGHQLIMGKNSRKLAKEEFDWKKIAERYLKVYEEVAK